MSDIPPPTPGSRMAPDTHAYWLLEAGVPTGPFPRDVVLARPAVGAATPQTPACPVGGTGWRPLAELPEFGPTPADPPAADPPVPPAPRPPAADPGSAATAAGVAVVALLGYAGYEAFRPPTAREVAERFVRAATPAAAKASAAPALHPALDAVFAAAGPPAAGDEAAVARDEPAPVFVGGHYAWARSTAADPDAGRRVAVDCRLHLAQADGWTVDDVVVLAVDGRRLDPPPSLAQYCRERFPAARPAADPHAAAKRGGLLALFALVKGGGAKAVGAAVLAAPAGLWAALRRGRPAR